MKENFTSDTYLFIYLSWGVWHWGDLGFDTLFMDALTSSILGIEPATLELKLSTLLAYLSSFNSSTLSCLRDFSVMLSEWCFHGYIFCKMRK